MDKETIVLKTSIKGILDVLIKKLIIVAIAAAFYAASDKVRKYVANKYHITDSIFKADILGTVSMVLVYIVMAVLFILLLIALYRFLILFYELGRVTTIDFSSGKITIKKYDFPFEKQIFEKKFNKIVGIEIVQKTIDRAVKCGNLYIEYLVLSKNDSKLRGIEVPYVHNPADIKDRLLED
ncbi:hypothetical protein M2651_10710 [Clostridium sp. SYSU_GA19001]|uniref:hypothetical protein n=1 Tax=Clostridium caldaquaticum TaxID=2940653 RepID=UPI00207763F2|nr:hypothetical protein [Clostridium caldaquaticum]MCM8711492.1 hypothetical protein [Clostridium caldaquaticum]